MDGQACIEAVTVTFVSIVMLIQSALFIWSSDDGQPMLRSYVASWVKALSILYRFFAFGGNAEERKDSAIALVWLVLCLPGAILLAHVWHGW